MADWSRDNEEHMTGGVDEEEGIISQEDCWSVIQSYFDENVSALVVVKGANNSLLCKRKLRRLMSLCRTRSRN